MKKYTINSEMLGCDATEEQAEKMVEILNEMGYDVEYTSDCGNINHNVECPIPERVWEDTISKIILCEGEV